MMMRSVLPGILLVAAASASVATAEDRQVGARIGPSFAVVTFEPEDEVATYQRRIAVRGGAFAVLPITRRLALQTEVLFSPKGGRVELDGDATGKLLLEYVDIPVLARIAGPRFGSRSIHVFGGPYVGVRVSAKTEMSSAGQGFTAGSSEDISRDIERFELGLVGGAGVDIGPRVVVDGRYAWGLTNVNTDTSEGVRVRNRVFSILAGVRF